MVPEARKVNAPAMRRIEIAAKIVGRLDPAAGRASITPIEPQVRRRLCNRRRGPE